MTDYEATLTQETQPTPEQILASGAGFLAHFGVQNDPQQNKQSFLDALRQLDPRFQGNRDLVRWQLESDTTEWDDETKKIIMDTAEAFGILRPETPLVGEWDVVISLGAARQANLDRPNYAVKAIKSGQAEVGMLMVTGSDRKLNEQEQGNVANYSPDAKTEFDLATSAAELVANENPAIVVNLAHIENERANNADVIRKVLSDFQASRGGASLEGLRIAFVTTQIYQPFTSIEAKAIAE
jgi:hypothetical protein